MLITFISLTGNVRNFVKSVEMRNLEVDFSNPLIEINEDFIIIVPTYDSEITDIISELIEYKDNIKHLIGFVGSGSLNFDKDYCFNAKDLSNKYDKPLLFTFEFSGTNDDVVKFKKEVEEWNHQN
ncbi:class Ib ribonucleoside-diphosphate reductase assembly flavoprotein NrdI [Halobacillus rhizosphaerae]|uniref:ribonucleotide reductase stimulatory protein n=1 Tax=Halobacillus rhizosphaerae TaxID=3064889 RepID=UPI00398B1329